MLRIGFIGFQSKHGFQRQQVIASWNDSQIHPSPAIGFSGFALPPTFPCGKYGDRAAMPNAMISL
jgi:hypothetical protein